INSSLGMTFLNLVQLGSRGRGPLGPAPWMKQAGGPGLVGAVTGKPVTRPEGTYVTFGDPTAPSSLSKLHVIGGGPNEPLTGLKSNTGTNKGNGASPPTSP